MPQEMQGRRLAIVEGKLPVFERAGDYCGPITGYTLNLAAVFFLLPVARDEGAHGSARSVHHVTVPPHVLTEEPDGSLTLRNSIGAEPHWHGFLTEGRWELKPSK